MTIKHFIKKRIFEPYSSYYEKYRTGIIKSHINIDSNYKILDFGGSSGKRMANLFPERKKGIYIADISEKALDIARTKYGFKTILLDESGTIPFEDKYFDFVFCNSVIEHVTVNKDDVYRIMSNKKFRDLSFSRQSKLAKEINRVGKQYFVQTPNKHFFIESHLWFPSFLIYMPRRIQIALFRLLNKFWIKKANPDFSLLTYRDMKMLFGDAKIIREKLFFFVKSYIAIKISNPSWRSA